MEYFKKGEKKIIPDEEILSNERNSWRIMENIFSL